MTCRRPSTETAYSTVAPSPPPAAPEGGMMLPALRSRNRSPGSVDVIRFGFTRESEQVMNSASGLCGLRPSASKRSRCSRKTVSWKRRTPCKIFSISEMEKILQGVRRFQETVFREQRERFEALGRKPQSPLALFITCSDSRVNPNLITSTEPGDLFLLRNAGNIIPPSGAAGGGEGATVEYAVSVLGLRHVIVCGHYHCGAMHHLLRGRGTDDLPAV